MTEQPQAPRQDDRNIDIAVDPAEMTRTAPEGGDIDPDLKPASSNPDAMTDDGALGGTAGQGGAG